jgi:hypothetical protein
MERLVVYSYLKNGTPNQVLLPVFGEFLVNNQLGI